MGRFKAFAGLLLIWGLLSFNLQAQSHTSLHTPTSSSSDTGIENRFRHNRLSILMYHSYFKIKAPDGAHLVIIPSIGLDYEYWLSDRWGIGLHNDLIFTHKVEQDLLSGNSFPFLTSIDGLYKVYKGLVLLVGPGIEFEEHDYLFFMRGGVEYEIHFGSHWDVCPTIFFDNRRGANNACSIGLGIGKRF